MTAKPFQQHLKISALALALSLSLSACTTTSTNAPTADINTTQAFSALELTTEQYQAMVQAADDDSRFPAMVLLARSAIVSQDFVTAESVIEQMKASAITPLQHDQATIVEGLMRMHQSKNPDALQLLNTVNTKTLPTPVASFYYQLSATVKNNLFRETHQVDNLLNASRDKLALLSYITPEAKQSVALQIIQDLQQLPASELTNQLNSAQDPALKGCMEFALIDSSQSPQVKQQLIQSWKNKYPNHPLTFAANNLAAGNNANASTQVSTGPVSSLKEGDHLAVLLPLSGRFAANVGEPARLGILAALQDRNSKLKVTFYDTNKMTIAEIGSAIAQNSTDFIIGPILKPEVDALIATNISKPAIVFNQPASPRSNLYYYNLGPDYEGALAAAKIYHDGHVKPLLIAPESTRGQRAINGFNQVWQQTKTANNPVVCRYNDINNAKKAMTTCPVNNADSYYINATANEVIKIRPLLTDSTPLYLTDRSYMGVNHSSGEIALNGAYLGDMPWLLTDNALKQDLMATLPKADTQIQRIFASAYDSINLAFNLGHLYQNREDVLHGISGDLQIGKNGMIEMAPMWVRLGAQRPVN